MALEAATQTNRTKAREFLCLSNHTTGTFVKKMVNASDSKVEQAHIGHALTGFVIENCLQAHEMWS